MHKKPVKYFFLLFSLSSYEDFLNKALYPSGDMLTNMATYMTFSDQNMVVQWWIEEMHTDDGMIVKTDV